jgi:FAD/FMN-containing dehydrogenase
LDGPGWCSPSAGGSPAGHPGLHARPHGRESAFVAVHVFQGMPYEPAFREVEAALSALGGRPHWGKRSFLTAAELAPRYPRWERFQALRRRLDPGGRFANAWLRDVLG